MMGEGIDTRVSVVGGPATEDERTPLLQSFPAQENFGSVG